MCELIKIYCIPVLAGCFYSTFLIDSFKISFSTNLECINGLGTINYLGVV